MCLMFRFENMLQISLRDPKNKTKYNNCENWDKAETAIFTYEKRQNSGRIWGKPHSGLN